MNIVDRLGLSYNSVQKLNGMIDTELPGRPHFQPNVLDIGDEQLEFYSRDVLECIRSLYGDPSWAQEMAFAPERHYTSHARMSRIYNELYTSDWWWTVQVLQSTDQFFLFPLLWTTQYTARSTAPSTYKYSTCTCTSCPAHITASPTRLQSIPHRPPSPIRCHRLLRATPRSCPATATSGKPAPPTSATFRRRDVQPHPRR